MKARALLLPLAGLALAASACFPDPIVPPAPTTTTAAPTTTTTPTTTTVVPPITIDWFTPLLEHGWVNLGQVVSVYCPPDASPNIATLFGTDVYDGASGICIAGAHAGLITRASGGTLAILVGAPVAPYVGSTRNGVTSASLADSVDPSFTFI